MRQIEGIKPLCYRLSGSQKIVNLSYADDELSEYRSKALYLIKAQQQNMSFNPDHYLAEMQKPVTPYSDSPECQKKLSELLERNELKIPQEKLDKKVLKGNEISKKNAQQARFQVIQHQRNIVKELNLQVYKKIGPTLFKTLISNLDNQKKNLQQHIEKEKVAIEEINKARKYEQLEAQDREQTIMNRTLVMIHKIKKI